MPKRIQKECYVCNEKLPRLKRFVFECCKPKNRSNWEGVCYPCFLNLKITYCSCYCCKDNNYSCTCPRCGRINKIPKDTMYKIVGSHLPNKMDCLDYIINLVNSEIDGQVDDF